MHTTFPEVYSISELKDGQKCANDAGFCDELRLRSSDLDRNI